MVCNFPPGSLNDHLTWPFLVVIGHALRINSQICFPDSELMYNNLAKTSYQPGGNSVTGLPTAFINNAFLKSRMPNV